MSEPHLVAAGHFLVGGVSILAGLVAFAAPKGRPVHRAAGAVFTVSMLILCASGLWMSLARGILFTVFLAWIAAHAVTSGWAAANTGPLARWITRLAALSSFSLVASALAGGVVAGQAPGGALNGLTPPAFFGLAGFALLLAVFDLAFSRARAPSRGRRLARHAGRMGLSMFLATGIFFFGNNHVLPEVMRTGPILSAPVLLVLALTAFHMARARLFGARTA
ncbi:hypothetical protein [Brevundimonas sp.]|uniref:hypothetical protein n=1 Tax=Brevundimonas sp. TaxID=1871086 RepID=UPI00391D8E18